MAKEEVRPTTTAAVDLQATISALRGDLERSNAEVSRLRALLSERERELVEYKGTLAVSATISIPGLEDGEGQLREGVTLMHQVGEATVRSWARPGDVVTCKGQERATKLQGEAGQQLQVYQISADLFRLLAPHLKQ